MNIFKLSLIVILVMILTVSKSYSQDNTFYQNGLKALTAKKYKEAIINFDKSILFTKKKDKYSYYNRGLSYLYINNLEKSITDFKSAIELDTNYADAYNSCGLAYFLQNDYGFAFQNYEKAISLDSTFGQAYLNRATLHVETSNYAAASKDFEKVFLYDSLNPELYFNYARMLYRQKNYISAIENFNKSVTLGLSNNEKLYYNRANSYFKLGQYQYALEDYNRAIELDPEDYEAVNNRAMTYDMIGDKENAQKDRVELSKVMYYPPNMVPYDSINYIKYKTPDNELSIELPDNWYSKYTIDSDVTELIVSPEDLDKNHGQYAVGVRLVINKNMKKNYQVSQPTELITFWEGSNQKNIEDYADYKIFSKKNIMKGVFNGFVNHAKIQTAKDAPPMQVYEYILAKEDVLFFGYLQAPDSWFPYYSKIFDYAVKFTSLKQK